MRISRVTLTLLVAFGGLIAIFGTVGYLSLNKFATVTHAVQTVVDQRWQKVKLAREALRYSTLNSRLTMQVFLLADKKEIERLLAERAKNSGQVFERLKTIEAGAKSETEKALVANIWTRRVPYMNSYKLALNQLLTEGKPEAARQMMAGEVLTNLIAYHAAWEAFVTYQGAQMDQAGAVADAGFRKARQELILLVGVATLLVMAIAVFAIRNLTDEMARRQSAEQELRAAKEVLETRIQQRMAELNQLNDNLQTEVEEHERTHWFLEAVIKHLPIPVFIKEAKELRFVLWNQAGEALTGISNTEMLGKNDHDFFPAEDAARNVATDRAVFEKKRVLEIPEETMQTRHHGVRTVHVRKVPIFDAAGQPTYLLGICEDITEHKALAAALAQSHELYRRAITAANAVPYQKIYGETAYAFMGEGIQDITGYTPAEMRTTVWKEIILETVCLGAAAGLPAAEATRRVLAGELKNWQTDHHIRTRSGEIRWISDCSIPMLDAAGKYAGSIGIIQDITERKAAEMALRQSEDRFRLLVEESPDMIGIYQAGKLVFINTIGTHLLGAQTPAELLGRSSEQVIHPDDLPDVKARLQRRAAGELGVYPAEVRYLRMDGTSLPVEVSAAPILFEGQPAMQFVARDISERKQAVEAMIRSERKFRTLFDSTTDAVMLLDETGFFDCNQATLAILGCASRAEFCTKTPADISPPQQPCGQDSRMLAQERIAAAMATGSQRFEWMHRRLDTGTTFPAEVLLSVLRLEGRPIIQAVVRDITVRRQAEELMRLQEAALRSAANVIVITDRRGLIVWTNPAFTMATGYTAAEALGKNPRVLKQNNPSNPYPATFYQDLWQTISGGVVWHGEFHNCRKDGTALIEDTTITPVLDREGQITHFIAVKQDITARKAVEAERVGLEVQLRHAQKLESIGQLAAGIAHEINTPTQYVGDNLRFLQESLAGLQSVLALPQQFLPAARENRLTPEMIAQGEATLAAADLDYLSLEIPKAITDALQGVGRVSKIVHAMKDFSHPGSENKAPVDLNQAIESTLTVARNEWKYVAEMVMEFDPNLPPVPCYAGEFNQVILNLVVNAAHAIGDTLKDRDAAKGTITVSTQRDGDWVEVRLRDTGTGIPEAARGKIFTPFFTTKVVGKGTGQGLAIARSVIVDKHGGTICFETAIGQGTVFVIRLPVVAPAVAPKAAVAA